MSFYDQFSIRRPSAASFRNRSGAVVIAPVNGARFDHLSDGQPIGLLVEPGTELGQQDQVQLKAALPIGPMTVLHETGDATGASERRALYTLDANPTVAGCLTIAAHHRVLGVVPGFLPIRRGSVAYLGKLWTPPAILRTTDGRALQVRAGAVLLAS